MIESYLPPEVNNLAGPLQDQLSKSWVRLFRRGLDPNKIFKKDQGWIPDLELVRSIVGHDTVVINMSVSPFNQHEHRVVDAMSAVTNDFVVLSGDVNFFTDPHEHICFFPFWYLSQKNTGDPLIAVNRHCRYPVSSLNSRNRYHRIENFIKLRERPYFDQMLFVMHATLDNLAGERADTPRGFWRNEVIKKFKDLQSTLKSGGTTDLSINDPAYLDSYINYVTETSVRDNLIYLSEKSWKPIMAGQFGIWLSNPGQVNHLRSIGFDVFDDIIDHSYDIELDPSRRIDAIHSSLDQIMTLDLDRVFQDTLARRQANLDLFYSDSLEQLLTRQCDLYRV